MGAQVYYNVTGTVPLEAKLNSGGFGAGNQGDIVGALVDVETTEKPRMSGYVISADDNNDVTHESTYVPELEPSGAVIKESELYLNIAYKKIYTIDDLGNSILLGAAIAEDAEKLGGIEASGYARLNGSASARFKVAYAVIDTEATPFGQVGELIYDAFRDPENTDLFVPHTRTVNGKELSTNITLSNGDVGAAHEDIAINGVKFSSRGWDMTLGASDIDALPTSHAEQGASQTALGHIKASYSNGRLDIWTY